MRDRLQPWREEGIERTCLCGSLMPSVHVQAKCAACPCLASMEVNTRMDASWGRELVVVNGELGE